MVRPFRDRRPRLLAPSRILRETPRQTGGGASARNWSSKRARRSPAAARPSPSSPRLLDRRRARTDPAALRLVPPLRRPRRRGARSGRCGAVGSRRSACSPPRALEGHPTADIAFDSFGQVAKEAGLTEDMAEDVIEGFALDVAGWRPRTEADLMRYCYHVAGAVGVMAARALGRPGRRPRGRSTAPATSACSLRAGQHSPATCGPTTPRTATTCCSNGWPRPTFRRASA